MSRDPHNDDEKPQPKADTGHSSWKLNRLSSTGRSFLLEPGSRASIVQELQARLRREQQRREQMLLLSSRNNTQQDLSTPAVQEASNSKILPGQQLRDEEEEVAGPSADLVASNSSADRDARMSLNYTDAPEPKVTRGLESEPEATNQQSMATDSAPVLDTDMPQRETLPPRPYSVNSTTELALEKTSERSSLTIGQDQEPPSQDKKYKQPATSMGPEEENVPGSKLTSRSTQIKAGSSPDEEQSPIGIPSESIRQTGTRSETFLLSRLNNDRAKSTMENHDHSDNPTSLVGRYEDSSTNRSFLPMRQSRNSTTEITSTAKMPMASPRRNSVRSAQSIGSLPAMESAKSVPMASPRRNSFRSENQMSAEAPTAAGEDARDLSSKLARRDSIRSATTISFVDSQSGEKGTQSLQQSQLLRTTPCLQCLMRCLQNSGLLGSCWKAALIELEEAFVLREVADAATGKSVGVAGGESMQQRLPAQHSQSASVENSTVESPIKVEVNKWQALERLCQLRKSLQTCSHLSDA